MIGLHNPTRNSADLLKVFHSKAGDATDECTAFNYISRREEYRSRPCNPMELNSLKKIQGLMLIDCMPVLQGSSGKKMSFFYYCRLNRRVVKCLSRMTRKCHVRFLCEGEVVTLPHYSANRGCLIYSLILTLPNYYIDEQIISENIDTFLR